MKKKWLSLYIYYKNEQKKDEFIQLISDKMEFLIQAKLIEKWFFIRYWEGGPHIRLRILIDPKNNQFIINFINDLKKFIYDNPNKDKFSKIEYLKNIKKFQDKNSNFLWHEDGDIIKVPYVPEYKRYGGIDLMPLTETMFQYSTRLVVNLLKEIQTYSQKILVGYIFTQKLFNLFFSNKKIKDYSKYILNQNISFWESMDIFPNKNIQYFLNANSKYDEEIWSILIKKESIKNNILNFNDGFAKLLSSLSDINAISLGFIATSHIHMFNNRLGCAPSFETSYYKNMLVND